MVELDQKGPKGKADADAICERQVWEGEGAGSGHGKAVELGTRSATQREAERPAALAPPARPARQRQDAARHKQHDQAPHEGQQHGRPVALRGGREHGSTQRG